MSDCLFFIDMHGVLINSSKMLQNYENILIDIFGKHDIPKDKALEYHYAGLKLYTTQLRELEAKKLIGQPFLAEMDKADKQWDTLLQSFVKKGNSSDLESRNVEYLAGEHSDSFYKDGKTFIQSLEKLTTKNPNIKYFIVSNSHSKHIEGLFKGAGFNSFDTTKLLGWDKMESLKNNEYYYKKLREIIGAETKIIIGNSKQEMVLGKKTNFNTVFVEREFKGPIDFQESIDLMVKNLDNFPDKILNTLNINFS